MQTCHVKLLVQMGREGREGRPCGPCSKGLDSSATDDVFACTLDSPIDTVQSHS